MQLNVTAEEEEAYQNFVESIRDSETLRKYNGYLKYFLDLIPNAMFKEYLGYEPKSRGIEDLAGAFTAIALTNVKNAKGIVKAYVKELKILHHDGKIKASTLKNKLKPIKKLCKANDVEISWHLIDQSLPRIGKSEDRSYTLLELQDMIRAAKKLLDKVIVTMSSSGGFRVGAWDYFTWKDLIFFKNNNGTFKGAALLVYRGDIEEYATCLTPEACNYLSLYREEWKKRFLRYPNDDDPIIANARNSKITRLGMKGVRNRVSDLITSIGIRPPLTDAKKRHEVMVTHGFRKSWSTNMRRAKVDFADKEEMMGHSIGQEKSYQRYVEGDFEWFESYQKAIPLLTISDEQRSIAELLLKQKKLDEMEQKNLELEKKDKRLDTVEAILIKLVKSNLLEINPENKIMLDEFLTNNKLKD